MRHRVAGRHLKRDKDHRRALYRNLITQLFRHERIKTTEAKAKAIRPAAEKLITLAKRGDAERLMALAREGNLARLKPMVGERQAQRLVDLAGSNDEQGLEKLARELALHARRQVLRTITDKEIVDKLIHDIAADYVERPGGYTRILRLGPRLGDAAPMVLIELVE